MKTAARIAILAVALAVTVTIGGSTIASGKSQGTTHFSFKGYANNVKVVEPLVGPWQLGKAITRGSGYIGEGSNFGGSIHTHNYPKYERYPDADLKADIIGYHYLIGPHNTYRKATFTIEVTRAVNGGERCVPGVRGKLKLLDSKAELSNGQPADYILTQHWANDACPSFVQGWVNADGGARTKPHYGGPPDGGQWAVVTISSPH